MVKRRTSPRVLPRARWAWLLSLCASLASCAGSKKAEIQGPTVMTVQAMPGKCEDLGVVTGKSGGLLGGYVEKESLIQAATEDAEEKAAKLGATHFVAHPAELQHGTAQAVTRNQQPALGHGDASTATATVTGTAYRCEPLDDGTEIVSTPPMPSSETVARPAPAAPAPAPATPAAPAISLQPLAPLLSVTVFQRIPKTPLTEAKELEVFTSRDPATLRALGETLGRAEVAALQFIPTHRIEFVGELGSHSLLYGFGHLKYAGHTYRLPDTELETTLGLSNEKNDGDE